MTRVLKVRWKEGLTLEERAAISDRNRLEPGSGLAHWEYLVQSGDPPEVEIGWIPAAEYWEGAR